MSQLHALLIGIDDYFPKRLPDGTRYDSLHGPTRDVRRMALLLRDRFGLQPERTRMLLSWAGEERAPGEPPERRPTYANMVAAFKLLTVQAEPGDRVYIHYSGHGARTPTQLPAVKGTSGQDEVLVPCDIGDPDSRYLRDFELATLVELLVDHGLLVTLVLDCCHAGGAMRGGEWQAVPRKVFKVRSDPAPSAVAEPAVLTEVWRRLQQRRQPAHRGLTFLSGLPVARYALFAACRKDELAYELPFERGEPQGALTYWLQKTLRRSGRPLTCGELHQKLVARVHGQLVGQTPVFLGESERYFLSEGVRSAGEADPLASPTVLRLDDESGRVLIGVGDATGVRLGNKIRVQGTELEIRQIGATESWAEVVRVLGPEEEIEPGARAEILPLRAAVRLVPPAPGDPRAEQALLRLRASLRTQQGGFLEVCEEGHVPDLCVRIGEGGVYEILDPGGVPFPYLSPLSVDSPDAVQKVVRRLDHLAKFRNILTVENPEPAENLKIGLELREGGVSSILTSPALDLRVGESLTLWLVNRSNLCLAFTVLNLDPDYAVRQLLPNPGSINLLELDPGEEYPLSLKGWLPEGYDETQDILKIFATLGNASFRWLELPALNQPPVASPSRGTPRNALEQLFARLAAVRPTRHGLTPSEFPQEEWITAQVEIRVRR